MLLQEHTSSDGGFSQRAAVMVTFDEPIGEELHKLSMVQVPVKCHHAYIRCQTSLSLPDMPQANQCNKSLTCNMPCIVHAHQRTRQGQMA